jgi:hypothetical protein
MGEYNSSGEVRNAYRDLMENPEKKRTFLRWKSRCVIM